MCISGDYESVVSIGFPKQVEILLIPRMVHQHESQKPLAEMPLRDLWTVTYKSTPTADITPPHHQWDKTIYNP